MRVLRVVSLRRDTDADDSAQVGGNVLQLLQAEVIVKKGDLKPLSRTQGSDMKSSAQLRTVTEFQCRHNQSWQCRKVQLGTSMV